MITKYASPAEMFEIRLKLRFICFLVATRCDLYVSPVTLWWHVAILYASLWFPSLRLHVATTSKYPPEGRVLGGRSLYFGCDMILLVDIYHKKYRNATNNYFKQYNLIAAVISGCDKILLLDIRHKKYKNATNNYF